MARIATPGPDVEADITREQIAAYMLANGWHEERMRGDLRCFRFGAHGWHVSVPENPGVGTIRAIAQVMKLHPSAVLLGCAGAGG